MTVGKRSDLEVHDFMTRVSGMGQHPKPWGKALTKAALEDERIVCLCADLAAPTETDYFRDHLPERFYQVGIAEANMIGMAAGMARTGDIAFVHSFCVFATKRCYDQISMQAAYPRQNVKIIGFIPGLSTYLGVTHQAIEDVAIMRALPNMVVLEPSGPEQFASAVQAALSVDGPVYLRMTSSFGAAHREIVEQPLEVGKGYLLRDGTDGVIIATGMMVAEALEAADRLVEKGVDVAVINMSSIKPLDEELILRMVRKTGTVVTAENHTIIGGLGSAVGDLLLETGNVCRFRRVGIADTFAEGGTTNFLFDKYGLRAANIVNAFVEARV
ncbi:MAG: hypothetical protein KF810_13565 [Rhizobiaceae bacterium]|nr:hypothetical protein [Rhizobiaceae bacterium]